MCVRLVNGMRFNGRVWVTNSCASKKSSIALLETNPERRPPYYRGFRRVLTPRFPCKVFYRTESHQVIVFRILHARRDHRRSL